MKISKSSDQLNGDLRSDEVFDGSESALVSVTFENANAIAAIENVVAENINLRHALAYIPVGFCMFKDDRLELCNQQYLDVWDLPVHLATRGISFSEIMANSHGTEISFSGESGLGEIGHKRREFRTRSGKQIEVLVHVLDDGTVVALHEDVTKKREADARISYLAKFDPLTDLRNRGGLYERLAKLLEQKEPGGASLLYLDLDGFKLVNDTLGHPVGDELLCLVSKRLKSCCTQADLAARLGGDEFAVVVANTITNPDKILAQRIIDSISEPYDIGGRRIHIGASIGIVIIDDKCQSSDEIVRRADLALYHAKSNGGGVYRYFAEQMETDVLNRRAMVDDLNVAIKNDQFELYYQPQIDISSMKITGAEALIRWNHPTRGFISPDDFIPLAEETGLIVPIGRWVMNKACSEATRWPDHLTISVNVSGVQCGSVGLLEVDLLADVVAALDSSKLLPERLELEITETAFMDDVKTSLALFNDLSDMGVKIAIDDFGTGYSSMQYLRSFPFDRLKIDRSFVMYIDTEQDALAIIKTIIDLANGLDISTTAEGVETVEQLKIIQHIGCQKAQGYLFAKPCPIGEFRTMVENNFLSNPHLDQAA